MSKAKKERATRNLLKSPRPALLAFQHETDSIEVLIATVEHSLKNGRQFAAKSPQLREAAFDDLESRVARLRWALSEFRELILKLTEVIGDIHANTEKRAAPARFDRV